MRTSVLDTLARRAAPQRRPRVPGRRRLRARPRHASPRRSPAAPRSPASSGAPTTPTLAAILGAVPPQPRHAAYAAAGDVEHGGPWGPAARPTPPTPSRGHWPSGRSVGLDLVVACGRAAPRGTPVAAPQLSLADGTVVGHAGELHPKVTAALDLPGRTVAGELDVDVARRGHRHTRPGQRAVHLPVGPHRRRPRRRRDRARRRRRGSPA